MPSYDPILVCDRIITPMVQRVMAEGAGATIIEIRAGHLAMITHPATVGDVANQAVRATA
jgi:hypothetical protein